MSKDTTTCIKGVAILLMLMHHFLVSGLFADLPDWLIDIGLVFKICVAIYAVLSGYGYFFAKSKTVRYGLKKIWGLLQIYWISLFTLFYPVAVGGGYQVTPENLVINLFGLLPNLNWFAWYVFFFVFCMLVMPFAHRAFRFGAWADVLLALIVPYACEIALHSAPGYEDITAVHDLFSCFLYLPCFLMGFLMAKYDVVRRVRERVGDRLWIAAIVFLVAFACRYFAASVFGFLLDVFYAPAVICSLACLFERTRFGGAVGKAFLTLGKYSTGMWFFHAVFFSTYVSDVFQPMLIFVAFPPLMYAWLVVLSMAGAAFYEKVLDTLRRVFSKARGALRPS